MKKKPWPEPRLDPSTRIAPQYDHESIKLEPMATREQMGFRVVDNFPEEHIQ